MGETFLDSRGLLQIFFSEQQNGDHPLVFSFLGKRRETKTNNFRNGFAVVPGEKKRNFLRRPILSLFFCRKTFFQTRIRDLVPFFTGTLKYYQHDFLGVMLPKKRAPQTPARVAKNRSPAQNFFLEEEASWYALLFLLLFSFAAARLWPQGRTEEEEEEEELEEDYRGSVARGWLRQDIQRFFWKCYRTDFFEKYCLQREGERVQIIISILNIKLVNFVAAKPKPCRR